MQENIIHTAAIKLRAVGAGNLIPTLYGLDLASNSPSLVSIPLSGVNAEEPLRLANFVSQKVIVQLATINLNDNFTINRIVIYIKPIWTARPG